MYGDLNAQAVFPVAENAISLGRAMAWQTAECTDFSVQDKHNRKEWVRANHHTGHNLKLCILYICG